MIKSRIPSFFQINSSIAFPLVSLAEILTHGQDKLSTKTTKCVFHGYSRLQRGYRCYSPDTHQYFISADVSFFKNSSMFPTNHPPNSDVISLSLLYPIPDISSVPPATPPQPLQVYTRRPGTDTEPPTDPSPMAPSSRTPVLSPANLPTVVQKGTRSSRNLHPIHNFLTNHCLSSPYSAFISTLFFVSLPKTVRPSLIRARNGQWLKKWLLCILLAHGT